MRSRLGIIRSTLLLLLIGVVSCGDLPDRDPENSPAVVSTDTASAPAVDGMHEFRDNNNVLIMRGEKRDGKREGTWESYFPDGSLRSRSTFINGLQQGPTIVNQENGKVFYTGTYIDGKPGGDWIFHDEDGVPEKLVRYDDQGQIIEQQEL